ncbi:Ribbon-helix-helix protein, copG family [Paraburkholderia aspalathi]|uniref:Ribbon-helix-helix protein, copG family n=2 Tax=Paraburkholderia aspalathi TaxID=1324617 RepID=A0A1I7B672_9BURK|nr:Ribbon-helix-helix protein, copG family [Paraburkholderia aspalathi]
MPVSMTRSIDAEIKRVTVTLPRRQLDALQTIAVREDVSVAWLVRKAVDRLLRDGPDLPVTDRVRQNNGAENES